MIDRYLEALNKPHLYRTGIDDFYIALFGTGIFFGLLVISFLVYALYKIFYDWRKGTARL